MAIILYWLKTNIKEIVYAWSRFDEVHGNLNEHCNCPIETFLFAQELPFFTLLLQNVTNSFKENGNNFVMLQGNEIVLRYYLINYTFIHTIGNSKLFTQVMLYLTIKRSYLVCEVEE